MSFSANASAALNATGFDASEYVPQNIQDDYATGKSYYDQFQAATQGLMIAPGGRIELTDAQAHAALDGIVAGMAAAGPGGVALGALTAAILALGPKAGSGPGVCSTSPPPGPLLSQLQSWPYFGSWADRFGSYPASIPNSFESFANPVLEYNWLLWNNCYDFQTPPPTLLATLIASWNATHDASSQRTVVRTGLNPAGFNPEGQPYDPIANALEMAILSKYAPTGAQTFQQATTASGAPNNVSSAFTINNGPEISSRSPYTLHLTLRPTTLSTAQSTAKTVVGVSAAAAGALTLAAIGISLLKGKAWDWAFGQAWAEIKDVFAAGGPHKFLTEARESNPVGREERSHSATQSLLFSRRKYTTASAKAWARAHGYRSGKVDVTKNYIHLPQQPASKFRRVRTVSFSKDIKAHIGFK